MSSYSSYIHPSSQDNRYYPLLKDGKLIALYDFGYFGGIHWNILTNRTPLLEDDEYLAPSQAEEFIKKEKVFLYFSFEDVIYENLKPTSKKLPNRAIIEETEHTRICIDTIPQQKRTGSQEPTEIMVYNYLRHFPLTEQARKNIEEIVTLIVEYGKRDLERAREYHRMFTAGEFISDSFLLEIQKDRIVTEFGIVKLAREKTSDAYVKAEKALHEFPDIEAIPEDIQEYFASAITEGYLASETAVYNNRQMYKLNYDASTFYRGWVRKQKKRKPKEEISKWILTDKFNKPVSKESLR